MANQQYTPEMAKEKIYKAKFEINLVDYVQQYGYEVNKEKSSASDVILQKKDGDTTLDTIGVRHYPATGYKYWTAMDSSDKGSLLDFEINKNQLNFLSTDGKKEFWKKVDDYLGNSENKERATTIKPADKKPESEVQRILTDRELNLLPLENTRYLEGRGLTEKSYRSPEFHLQVYNDKGVHEGRTFTNTVFPIRNEEFLISKSRKNNELLGYGGGQFNKNKEAKENGVHTSNFPTGKLDKLYLCEAPINAMSYLELKHKEIREQNEKVAFISTAGNPSHSAYNTIQKFINASQPKQIVSLMDNDKAGQVYTINMIGRLSKPDNDLSGNIDAEMSVSQKTEGKLSIKFSYDTDEKRKAMATTLKDEIIEPLKSNIADGSNATIQVSTVSKSSHHAHLEIKFPYNESNLFLVEKGLIKVKGLENEFSLEHPKQNDWNDELKKSKPFVVVKEVGSIMLDEKRFARDIEAYQYAFEKSKEQTKTMKVLREQYNVSHKIGEPELVASFKNGETLQINPILKQSVEAYQRDFMEKRAIEQNKLLALQLASTIFPANECVIVKSTSTENMQQHSIEFQTVKNSDKQPSLVAQSLDKSFEEKLNNAQTERFVVTFNKNQNTTHLMIPDLKESTTLEVEMVNKNKVYLAENNTIQKDEMLKKDLESQVGELKLADKQGNVIATSDYDVKVEGGRIVVHKVENYDYGKINRDGLDIGVVKNNLDEVSEEQRKSKNSVGEPHEVSFAKPEAYQVPKNDNAQDAGISM